MPESEATDKEQQALPVEGLWHDKILGDAIGYTKGLVNILDSLNQGFRRRGEELEDQRHRLAILQSERRSILEERAGLEAQIGSLAADRDGLLARLEERGRELETLRQAVSHDASGLEARTREVQDLRGAIKESSRQVEELREIVRGLERQLQRERRPADQDPSGEISAAPDDAQVGPLVAERDELRFALEAREQDLHGLRQAMLQGQAALDARTREVQELQAGRADSARQLEALRQAVHDLEGERESNSQRQASRVAEIEEELHRLGDAALQRETALREDLADAEDLLGEARKDLAGAQGRILSLERTLEAERSRTVSLEQRLQSQEGEIARLNATVQAAQTLLTEITGILGGAPAPAIGGGSASLRGSEAPAKGEPAESTDGASDQIQGLLTVVRPIVEAVQEVLGLADGSATQSSGPGAVQGPVRQRAQQIAEEWRRFLEERADLVRRARRLREENNRLSGQVAAMLGGREHPPERPQPIPGRGPQVRGAEAAPAGRQEEKTPPLPPADVRGDSSSPVAAPGPRKGTKRRGSFVGMTVECMLEGSGSETTRILRGEITRINTMGLMGTFVEPLSEGRRVIVRFARNGEEFSFLGRVVRVQQSAAASKSSPEFDHLIRFESALTGSSEQLAASLA